MSNVFPELMNKLGKDLPANVKTIEDYIRYMVERLEYSNAVDKKDIQLISDSLDGSVKAINVRLDAQRGQIDIVITDTEALADTVATNTENINTIEGDITQDKARITDVESKNVTLSKHISFSTNGIDITGKQSDDPKTANERLHLQENEIDFYVGNNIKQKLTTEGIETDGQIKAVNGFATTNFKWVEENGFFSLVEA